MQQPLLTAENITKIFNTPEPLTLFHDISLEIYPGQKVAIVGKSGEGKSTLLHILGTIEPASSGNIFIKGDIASAERASAIRNHSIGFIFQSFHLLNDHSVLDNVLMPMKIARKDTSKDSASYLRACALLEEVHLSHRLHFSCKKLSGGERQRVAIARAFANDPDIIFADEPTGNLDHRSALEVQKLLFAFTKMHQKALLLVTHNQELASQCDRCYILENGRLVAKNS